jgi:hypothetical protein
MSQTDGSTAASLGRLRNQSLAKRLRLEQLLIGRTIPKSRFVTFAKHNPDAEIDL